MADNKKKTGNNIFKTVSPERKKIFKIGGILLGILLLAIVIVLIVFFVKSRNAANAVEEPIDPYEKYVGPAEHEDRGEWMEPVEYYGFYTESGREGDVVGTMFQKEGDMKGVVPAGVRLQPVIVTYEDFGPYQDKSEYGYMNDYGCISEPEEVEVQLGVTADMDITGSYRNQMRDLFYDGTVNLSLADMSYYMDMTYDPDAMTEGEPEAGYYGFLEPRFDFDYDLNGEAHVTDDYPDYKGELTFTGTGRLSDGDWMYTSSMSGQGNDVFRDGKVYIRCKLPCKVKKEYEGSKTEFDSFVNVYFRISEVRLGTRLDAMPELETETGTEKETETEEEPEVSENG